MRLRKVISADKKITDAGAWKSGVKMPKTAFQLSKSHSFKVSAKFNWRVVCFESLGEKFKLLIYYRTDLENYHADLARDVGGDMLLMARLEFHATHPGWHIHGLCDSTACVPGRSGGTDKKIPANYGFNKQLTFGITNDRLAYDWAVKHYRLDKLPPAPLFELK